MEGLKESRSGKMEKKNISRMEKKSAEAEVSKKKIIQSKKLQIKKITEPAIRKLKRKKKKD
jgi:hypothetical protein